MAYQNGLALTHLNDARTASANQPGMPAGELRGYDGLQRITAHRWLHANLDASGFVTSYVTTTSVVGFRHAYDAADNKLSEARLHDSGNSEAYDYDSAYRLSEFDRGTLNGSLTEVTTPTTTSGLLKSQIWNLDGPGNWSSTTTTEVGGTPDTENRTHNNLNQISTIDSAPLVYDANGNLTDDGTYTYAWDAKNRLRSVTRKSDSVVVGRYSYDALGRRILRIYMVGADPAKTVHYYLDGQRVIEEREPSGGSEPLARQYTYGLYIDEALTLDRDLNVNGVATDAGERLFYHANSLYSVFGLSDSNRAFPERYLYDAYGRPIVWLAGPDAVYGTADDTRTNNGSSTVQNVRLFTGREWDVEGAVSYFRARYYSADAGRFLGRDPVDLRDANPNVYWYVEDRPSVSLDPTGEQVRKPNPIPAPSPFPRIHTPPPAPPSPPWYSRCLQALVRVGTVPFVFTAEVLRPTPLGPSDEIPDCRVRFPSLDLCLQFPHSTAEDAQDRGWPTEPTELGPPAPADECRSEGGEHFNVYREGHVGESAYFVGSILCCPCCDQDRRGDPFESYGCRYNRHESDI